MKSLRHSTGMVIAGAMLAASIVFGCSKLGPDRSRDPIIASLQEGSSCLLRARPPTVSVTDCNLQSVTTKKDCTTHSIKKGDITKTGAEVLDLIITHEGWEAIVTIKNSITDPDAVKIRVLTRCDAWFNGEGYIEYD